MASHWTYKGKQSAASVKKKVITNVPLANSRSPEMYAGAGFQNEPMLFLTENVFVRCYTLTYKDDLHIRSHKLANKKICTLLYICKTCFAFVKYIS